MSMIERKSENVKLTFGDMLYTIIRFKRYCMNWKDKLDPKLTKICTYIIGTVTALYLLYKLSDRFFVLLGSLVNFITYILGLLTPVFWGFFLAYLLLPLTDKIQEILANASWNKKDKTYRSAAVVITIILFCVGIVIFLSVLISTFTSQVQIADMESTTVFLRQIIDNLTGFITSITKELNKLNINSIQIEDAVQNAMNWLTSWGTNLGQVLGEGDVCLISRYNSFQNQWFSGRCGSGFFGLYTRTGDRRCHYDGINQRVTVYL